MLKSEVSLGSQKTGLLGMLQYKHVFCLDSSKIFSPRNFPTHSSENYILRKHDVISPFYNISRKIGLKRTSWIHMLLYRNVKLLET